jgi:hypothetical protein
VRSRKRGVFGVKEPKPVIWSLGHLAGWSGRKRLEEFRIAEKNIGRGSMIDPEYLNILFNIRVCVRKSIPPEILPALAFSAFQDYNISHHFKEAFICAS